MRLRHDWLTPVYLLAAIGSATFVAGRFHVVLVGVSAYSHVDDALTGLLWSLFSAWMYAWVFKYGGLCPHGEARTARLWRCARIIAVLTCLRAVVSLPVIIAASGTGAALPPLPADTIDWRLSALVSGGHLGTGVTALAWAVGAAQVAGIWGVLWSARWRRSGRPYATLAVVAAVAAIMQLACASGHIVLIYAVWYVCMGVVGAFDERFIAGEPRPVRHRIGEGA